MKQWRWRCFLCLARGESKVSTTAAFEAWLDHYQSTHMEAV